MKTKPLLAKYLIIIFLAPTLILLNFHLLVFNHYFYKEEFRKLQIYEEFKTESVVDTNSQKLISYLCCKQTLDGDFFSEREKLHMQDVKKLIQLSKIYFILFAAVTLGSTFYLIKEKQIRILLFAARWGSIFTVLSIIILFLSVFINLPKFEKSFTVFHEIVFSNDLWQQPPDANLIKIFPLEFFADFANRIAVQTILMAAVIIATSYFLRRKGAS